MIRIIAAAEIMNINWDAANNTTDGILKVIAEDLK
jgi:hypothetical protein